MPPDLKSARKTLCSDCLVRQVATRMASIRGGRGYAVPKAVPKAFEFERFFEVFSPGSSREALEGSEDPRGAHLLLQLPARFQSVFLFWSPRTRESTWERPDALGGAIVGRLESDLRLRVAEVYKVGDDVEVWSNSKRASGHLESLDVKHSKREVVQGEGEAGQAFCKHFASFSPRFCFPAIVVSSRVLSPCGKKSCWRLISCSTHSHPSPARSAVGHRWETPTAPSWKADVRSACRTTKASAHSQVSCRWMTSRASR